MANSWQEPPDYDLTESGPLISYNDAIKLSEFDVDGRLRPIFDVGLAAAAVHSFGFTHGDLNPANVIIDNRAGYPSTILDWASAKTGPIHPVRMATDFLVPHGTLDKPSFLAFLAGYVKGSYELIEHSHPGFTSSMLSILGGQIVTLPSPPSSSDGCRTNGDA